MEIDLSVRRICLVAAANTNNGLPINFQPLDRPPSWRRSQDAGVVPPASCTYMIRGYIPRFLYLFDNWIPGAQSHRASMSFNSILAPPPTMPEATLFLGSRALGQDLPTVKNCTTNVCLCLLQLNGATELRPKARQVAFKSVDIHVTRLLSTLLEVRSPSSHYLCPLTSD